MDTPALDTAPQDPQHERLNTALSLLVALSATFMALCNVKDGNVVQGMMQAQGNSNDAWSYYQAKSMKQNLAEATLDELTFRQGSADLSPEARAHLAQRIDDYRAKIAKYEKEKAEIKAQAEAHAREYDELNVHDDQLDIAEASFSISIALYGITALTRSRWLLVVALGFSAVGLLFGAAGFLRWGLHPAWLTRLLS